MTNPYEGNAGQRMADYDLCAAEDKPLAGYTQAELYDLAAAWSRQADYFRWQRSTADEVFKDKARRESAKQQLGESAREAGMRAKLIEQFASANAWRQAPRPGWA